MQDQESKGFNTGEGIQMMMVKVEPTIGKNKSDPMLDLFLLL